MRNPGWNTEQVWSAACDVKFNGVDFGPNLQYGKLTFLPAQIRTQQMKIAGMPGVYDYSKSPAGYPVPDNMKATLELFILRPLEWQTPVFNSSLGKLISPEAHFLSIINAGPVRLDFVNSNRMWLNAICKVTRYTRFDLGFFITLSLDCDPYWWESEPATIEWLFSAPSVNLFDPEDITISPTGRATCTYDEDPNDSTREIFMLNAPPNWYADVTIPNLDPENHYYFFCKNCYSPGTWKMFDDNNNELYRYWDITNTENLYVRLLSNSAEQNMVGFSDVKLYDVTGAGVYNGVINSLDNPIRQVDVTVMGKPANITIGDQAFFVPVSEKTTLYGLNIPPRSSAPVLVTGSSGCQGFISYQRGAISCTL